MSNSIEKGKITGANLRKLGHDVVDTGIKSGNLPDDYSGVLHTFIDSVVDNFAETGGLLTYESFIESAVVDIDVITILFGDNITLDMLSNILTIWLIAIPTVAEKTE